MGNPTDPYFKALQLTPEEQAEVAATEGIVSFTKRGTAEESDVHVMWDAPEGGFQGIVNDKDVMWDASGYYGYDQPDF